jgi:A/G-specific adenine glycosylase
MERFPTLDDIVKSDVSDVLSAWAGMGYYARARNLHRAALIIRAKYGGNWPQTRREWEALPGIGPYTAGAVLGIAFNKREAAVDGNVLRLYARMENDSADISANTVKVRATEFVQAHMPPNTGDVRAYTQALMELGSLVCTPTNPRCGICPLSAECKSRLAGRERTLPVKSKKKASPIVPVTVILIYSPKGRLLMRQRTEGLLKGMWVYCLVEKETNAADFVTSMGYTVETAEFLREATHTFTHRVWQMKAYAVTVGENHAAEGFSFLTPDEHKKAAIPAAMKYFHPFIRE